MTGRIRLTIGACDVEHWRSETATAAANRIQLCHGRLAPLGYNRGNFEGPDMEVSSTERFVRYWQGIHTRSRREIICILLGILRVSTPPLFGLTAEEVAAQACDPTPAPDAAAP